MTTTKKPIADMNFREQIGAAAKYGAFGAWFLAHGFRDERVPDSVTSPAELEEVVLGLATQDVTTVLVDLVRAQPQKLLFHGWSETDLLALRAILVLGVSGARYFCGEERTTALTRTFPKSGKVGEVASPYRDTSRPFALTRREKERLYDQLAEELRKHLPRPAQVVDRETAPGPGSRDEIAIDLIKRELYYPSSVDGVVRELVTVRIEALRDGVKEYRHKADFVGRGSTKPTVRILRGGDGHVERLRIEKQAGVPGYNFFTVFPFAVPMGVGERRTFSWEISHTVNKKYFKPGNVRVLGYRSSRRIRTAFLSAHFPDGLAPEVVAVNTNVRAENYERIDPRGDIRKVQDGHVSVTWPDPERGVEAPEIGCYCSMVWPR